MATLKEELEEEMNTLKESRDNYKSKLEALEQEMTVKMSNVKILEMELEEKLKKLEKEKDDEDDDTK